FSVLDLDVNRARDVVGATVSDANGEFRFTLDRGIAVDVHAMVRGDEVGRALDAFAGEYVEIRPERFRVLGRVTRASDDSPVAGASIRAFRRGGNRSESRSTTTGTDGSYEIRLPFDDRVQLEVTPLVEQTSPWIPVAFDAEGVARKDVEVVPGLIVTGRVTSAVDGLPIAGATVGEGWLYHRTATTDENGEYRLQGFGRPGVRDVFVRAPGFGQSQIASLPQAVDGVLRVDFVLEPARRAHGRVVARDGTPLEGVLVAAVASENGPEGQRFDWKWARTDAEGSFEIRDLAQDLRHALMLSSHGFATRVYDFPRDEMRHEDLDLGSFELGPPALIAGVVLDDDGVGVAGVDVSMRGSNTDRDRLSGSRRVVGEYYTDERRTMTDGRGRFSFGDAAAGKYRLEFTAKDHPPIDSVSVSLADGEQRDDLIVLAGSGERILGRVFDPEGRPAVSVLVEAELVEPRDGVESFTLSFPSTRTDVNGRFAFAGLEPGDYRLVARPESIRRDAAPTLTTAFAELVPTGSEDVVIRLERGTTISGVVRDAEGNAIAECEITARDLAGSFLVASCDAAGAFRLAVPVGGLFDLAARRPEPVQDGDVVFVNALEDEFARSIVARAVEAGTQDLELVVP
ncbi:MAG: carboxypeptidase-like regulatory domain-containing protein, partial [Planctomycetota bacterium]